MDALGPILGSQIMAPVIALDWPNTQKLIVTKMERHPRGLTTEYYDYALLREAEELPERLCIRGRFENGGIWNIGIDLEAEVLVHADWHSMGGHQHLGSAAIGVALFGLPALILTSPILLAVHGAYAIHQTVTGMDRHTWGIWQQLKGQLMSEDVPVVRRAFIKHARGLDAPYFERLRAEYDEKVRQERVAKQFKNRKDDITDGAFMVRYAAGCAEPEEIHDDIHDWHTRPGVDQSVTLHEWLGMTWDEYKLWAAQKKTLDQILEARKPS